MKVQICVRVGYRDRWGNDHKFGDVVDFPDELAAKVLRLGYAVPAAPTVETAAVAPARNTAKRTTKPKPRRKSQ